MLKQLSDWSTGLFLSEEYSRKNINKRRTDGKTDSRTVNYTFI